MRQKIHRHVHREDQNNNISAVNFGKNHAGVSPNPLTKWKNRDAQAGGTELIGVA